MKNVEKNNIEIIWGISHWEFLEKIEDDKSLQFQFNTLVFNDQRIFLKGVGKFMFYLFMYGYMIGPLFLVSLVAYHYNNWFMLFGILFSYLGTFLVLRNIKSTWVYPLLFLIWFWIKYGFSFQDYVTFYWIAFFFGNIFYQFAIHFEEEYAKIEVLNNPELFNKLSQQRKIYFMRKTESP